MKFAKVSSDNVSSFFPTTKWNDNVAATLFSDINPSYHNLVEIGTKVMFPFDGKMEFGEVAWVSGRHVTVMLENPIMDEQTITINWNRLKIADEKFRPKESEEQKEAEENYLRIKSIVGDIKSEIKNNFSDEYSKQDINTLFEQFLDKYERFNDQLIHINQLKISINSLEKELHEIKSALVKNGINENSLPEIISSVPLSEQSIKLSRRKHNADIKQKLDQIRLFTRKLLLETISSCGAKGISSEKIIEIICDQHIESEGILQQITPHRVMGMLSALSRGKIVFLNDNNYWVISNDITDFSL